jgi:hypothetical protein
MSMCEFNIAREYPDDGQKESSKQAKKLKHNAMGLVKEMH